MNLRKDHYRSFTRTLCTVSFLLAERAYVVCILMYDVCAWLEPPRFGGLFGARARIRLCASVLERVLCVCVDPRGVRYKPFLVRVCVSSRFIL